jgi:hypothetical protein
MHFLGQLNAYCFGAVTSELSPPNLVSPGPTRDRVGSVRRAQSDRALQADGEEVQKRGPVRALMVTQMRQHSLVRQKFRYVGVIAVILMFAVALCWGLAHI